MSEETTVITWTAIVNPSFAKCSLCAALVINSPQSKSLHQNWHNIQDTYNNT